MASSPAPATPNQSSRRWSVNRSATMPSSLATPPTATNRAPEIGATEGIEPLFFHPQVTVIKFTTSSSARPSPSSSSANRPGSSSGTLPWTSPTEITLAIGAFDIYAVPGSVSFLRCGRLVHAILPRSQCWCVDDVSKFVMRVLPDTYYRIELPGATQEDLQKVEQMKLTLQKVLFYERSACPFARTFSLDLPEMPDIKKRKRKSDGPAKKWKLDHASSWKPEGWEQAGRPESSGEGTSSGSHSSMASDNESEDQPHDADELADKVAELEVNSEARSSDPGSTRSVSAPTRITEDVFGRRVHTGASVDVAVGAIETAEARSRMQAQAQAQAQSTGTSSDRTYQTIPTDMPPSPPDSSIGADIQEARISADVLHTTGSEIEPTLPLPTQIPTADTATEVTAPTSIPHEVAMQYVGTPRDATPKDAMQADDAQSDAEEDTAVQHDAIPVDAIPPPSDNNLPSPALLQDPLKEDIQLSEETQEYMREIARLDDGTAHEQTFSAIDPAVPEPTDSLHSVFAAPSPPDDLTSFVSEDPDLPSDDPYAAIQARILARRSIGGNTSFHPANNKASSTRSSSSSTSSNGTITTNRSGKSAQSQGSKQHRALTTALVQKAYSVFLGPPAHLVALMLRIAARFASAAFGVDSMFYVATPVHTPRRVPGSFSSDYGGISSDEASDDSDEDDFGVPLRSPVRLTHREVEGDTTARASRPEDTRSSKKPSASASEISLTPE